jgi:hypothetical protein
MSSQHESIVNHPQTILVVDNLADVRGVIGALSAAGPEPTVERPQGITIHEADGSTGGGPARVEEEQQTRARTSAARPLPNECRFNSLPHLSNTPR